MKKRLRLSHSNVYKMCKLRHEWISDDEKISGCFCVCSVTLNFILQSETGKWIAGLRGLEKICRFLWKCEWINRSLINNEKHENKCIKEKGWEKISEKLPCLSLASFQLRLAPLSALPSIENLFLIRTRLAGRVCEEQQQWWEEVNLHVLLMAIFQHKLKMKSN